MAELKLTPSQDLAINYDKAKNVLVSASAGSGKTFVMTRRIIQKIKNGTALSSLFISTFTVKAAEELKNRLEAALKKELRNPENSSQLKALYSQALRELPLASIGTTDAFVNQLVKEHYSLVNIDPNFRIMVDSAEQDIIKKNVFENLLGGHLSEDKPKAFERLVKNFSNDRNVKGFQNVVYNIYNFCQSTDDPKKWLEINLLKGFDKFKRFKDLPDLTESVKKDLQDFYIFLESEVDNLTKATQEKAKIALDNEPVIFEALDKGNWQVLREIIEDPQVFLRWSLKNNVELKAIFDRVIGTKTNPGSVRTFIKKVQFADLLEKYHDEAKGIVENLGDFMQEFYDAYMLEKRNLNAYEFSDILHFALKILTSEEQTEIRRNYQNKFSEIMIDEYQDTNQAQESLYQLISDGHNIFMVGDIKQSIYGFRQADPELFQQKYETFPSQDKDNSENRLLLLQENFRSRKEVLDFTNRVFENLMENYGEQEALKFPERSGELLEAFNHDYDLSRSVESPKAELLLYSKENSEDGGNTKESESANDSSLTKGEIELAASKIIDLINNKVQPKDIVLLVRSRTNNDAIKEIFEGHQIPVILDDSPVNYLKSIEIQVMLDVLRAVNNPLFDIPFVATLHSPLFNFTDDDLARISLQEGENFWEKAHSENLQLDSKLYVKLTDFFQTFAQWRKIAKASSVYQLIEKIYSDTFYVEYASTLPNGEQRQANLKALITRAKSYESNGYKGLIKFIDMIDNYLLQENDLEDVNDHLPQNAVRVQTIHKSKGLEFDYVFIMNFQNKFNDRDLKTNFILDKEYGLGIKYLVDMAQDDQLASEIDFPHAMLRMDTIPYLYNRQRKVQSLLAEEKRMLYVAFTRAKKKLYMVAKIDKAEELEAENQLNLKEIPKKGYLSWILALKQKLKTDLIISGPYSEITFDSLKTDLLIDLTEQTSTWQETLDSGQDFVKAKEIIEFDSYDLSGSKLASSFSPSTLEQHYRAFDDEPVYEKKVKFDLDNLDSEIYTAADKGTAVHSFMQKIDFANIDPKKLGYTLAGMDLPIELRDQIVIPKIMTLFQTELGQRMIKNAATLKKEQPFSMLKSISNQDEKTFEQTVVRGIIDGYFIEEDKIVLFDYKTNAFSKDEEIDSLIDSYRSQQELYAEALQKAYPGHEIEKYLILLGWIGPSVKVAQIL